MQSQKDKISTNLNKLRTKDRETFNNLTKTINDKHDYGTIKKAMYTTGIWSPVYLHPDRILPDLPEVYIEVRYNPHSDRGLGNWIGLVPLTKPKNIADQSMKGMLRDQPLWILFYGYPDMIKKLYKGWDPFQSYRLAIRTPYTDPPLVIPGEPTMGYTVYDHNFATGRMPGGESYIPLNRRTRWFPYFNNQLGLVELFVDSGPFMPRDGLQKGWDLTCGYKSKWTLGGTLPPKQDPVDPCKVAKRELPDPGLKPSAVQVTDPQWIGPSWGVHPWEWRRGNITRGGLKRITQDTEFDTAFYTAVEKPPKRPRNDPIPDEEELEEEGGWSSSTRILRSLLQEQGETQVPRPDPQTPPEGPELEQQLLLHRELQQQRQQQRKLQQGIGAVLQQLLKTQSGVHLHPALR